jgi:hypothetical protein
MSLSRDAAAEAWRSYFAPVRWAVQALQRALTPPVEVNGGRERDGKREATIWARKPGLLDFIPVEQASARLVSKEPSPEYAAALAELVALRVREESALAAMRDSTERAREATRAAEAARLSNEEMGNVLRMLGDRLAATEATLSETSAMLRQRLEHERAAVVRVGETGWLTDFARLLAGHTDDSGLLAHRDVRPGKVLLLNVFPESEPSRPDPFDARLASLWLRLARQRSRAPHRPDVDPEGLYRALMSLTPDQQRTLAALLEVGSEQR